MKTAGVVIDAWKLKTFRTHLKDAGFAFTEHPGPTAETLTLRVKYEWVADLKPIIEQAHEYCARLKLAGKDKV